jgi:thiamine-monophosphate kinase
VDLASGKRSEPEPKRGSNAELSLLRRIRARAESTRGGAVRLGIGDDCALIHLRKADQLAVTTDLSIAGRHFRLDWHPPEVIGHRALARGLSDLAAMGARPVAAFLSLALPRELVRNRTGHSGRSRAWIDRFYDGFLRLAESEKTPLAGGDLAESPVAAADIVLLGAVSPGRMLLRSKARPGQLLYVTGKLGGAAAGLARLAEFAGRRGPTRIGRFGGWKIPPALQQALEPHLYPRPRIAQGLALARRKLATAGLDLSDGLSTDLRHLCEESDVAAEVDGVALPIFPGATLAQALHGGEDYELLFAAAPGTAVPQAIAGVALTRIGRLVRRRTASPLVTLHTEHGPEPLEARGWEHFLDSSDPSITRARRRRKVREP